MNKRKFLAGLLTLCMTLSLLPVQAQAALTKLPAPASVEILAENRSIKVPGLEWEMKFRKGDVLVTGIPSSRPDVAIKIIHLDTGECIEEVTHIIDDYMLESDTMSFPFGDDYEEPLPSGRYVAQVYFEGDDQKYQESDVVQSEPYVFQDPGTRYEAPTNLQWIGYEPRFMVQSESVLPVEDCMVEFLVTNSTGNYTYGLNGVQGATPENPEPTNKHVVEYIRDILSWKGPSEFSFRARVLTEDRTVCQNGPWSVWSEPIFISDMPADIESGLDDITNALPMEGTPTVQQKQDALNALYELDQEALKNSMAADREGDTVNWKIERLERTMGLTATVEKEPSSTVDVDPAMVSIVGAGLNTSNVEQPPKMTIKDAPENLKIPDAYQSTLQVDLSMEGVETQVDGTLNIPVRITMPVPKGMLPSELRILHFRNSDGQPELLLPYCFMQGETWMATFMVDHFSAFVLAQAGELETRWNKEKGTVQLLNHAEPQEIQLVVAGYDANGQQVGCASASGTTGNEQSLSVDVSALNEAVTLRAFMLDAQTRQPLTEAQKLF